MAGLRNEFTGTTAGLDGDANGNAKVNLPLTDTQAGFATMLAENDDGTVLGTRYMKSPEVSDDYRLRVGLDSSTFNLSFEGTTIAQAHIQQNLTTMTAAQASGFLVLNSGNATASGNAANIRTYRTFPLFGSFPTYGEFWLREGNATATNAVSEWGLGYATGTATPTGGVFFRRQAGGQLRGVVNFNGTETAVDITATNIPSRDDVGSYDPAEASHYLVIIHNDEAEFWVNNALALKIPCPSGQALPASSASLPMFARVYNSGVASAGRRIEIGFMNASIGDMDSNKPWSHIIAGQGGGFYQNQPGSTSGQTANHANSTSPTSATLSNTAAGYTTLGGRWQFAAPAGVATDYCLYGYQVPAGSATLPGKNFYLTGIRIDCVNTGAAVATTATILDWSVAVGSTSVSLATTDGAATVGPRRVPVGMSSWVVADAIGAASRGGPIEVDFSTPMLAPSGTFVQVIVQVPVGTATASQVIRGTCTPIGYYE